MLASLLIVFREVLEAGLIVGIVLAATVGVPGRSRWVAGGVAAGVVGAGLVALFADMLSQAFEGIGQELFTACILTVAVLMLSWHCLWMTRHAKELSASMNAVGAAVKRGERNLFALAIVVAVAVLREGSEVVLFLYGITVATKVDAGALLTGGALGILGGAGVSWLLYRGLLVIPARKLFSVTNGIIAAMAAGMAGQVASILIGVDLLPSWGDQLWDSSAILSEDSLLGRSLHALIGYSDRPTGLQAVVYVATLSTLLLLMRWIGQHRQASHGDRASRRQGTTTSAAE